MLDDLGIPKYESFEIIRGNLKMVQNPDGITGIDGQTSKDNWKPKLENCDRSRYPDPNDLEKIENNREKNKQTLIKTALGSVTIAIGAVVLWVFTILKDAFVGHK